MKEAKLSFRDFLNSLDLEEQKARRKSDDETLFKKKRNSMSNCNILATNLLKILQLQA